MYKAAVMGDYDSIYGFSALGLEVYGVGGEENAKSIFKRLSSGGYAVIYMTEACGEMLSEELEKLSGNIFPAVILIPGISGNTGKGIEGVRASVIKAVGSDIIFDKD